MVWMFIVSVYVVMESRQKMKNVMMEQIMENLLPVVLLPASSSPIHSYVDLQLESVISLNIASMELVQRMHLLPPQWFVNLRVLLVRCHKIALVQVLHVQISLLILWEHLVFPHRAAFLWQTAQHRVHIQTYLQNQYFASAKYWFCK